MQVESVLTAPLNVNGGRGRNRTYNLSIKSRMLCQLSYASRRDIAEGVLRKQARNVLLALFISR
jgi:hypothetical protein